MDTCAVRLRVTYLSRQCCQSSGAEYDLVLFGGQLSLMSPGFLHCADLPRQLLENLSLGMLK